MHEIGSCNSPDPLHTPDSRVPGNTYMYTSTITFSIAKYRGEIFMCHFFFKKNVAASMFHVSIRDPYMY